MLGNMSTEDVAKIRLANPDFPHELPQTRLEMQGAPEDIIEGDPPPVNYSFFRRGALPEARLMSGGGARGAPGEPVEDEHSRAGVQGGVALAALSYDVPQPDDTARVLASTVGRNGGPLSNEDDTLAFVTGRVQGRATTGPFKSIPNVDSPSSLMTPNTAKFVDQVVEPGSGSARTLWTDDEDTGPEAAVRGATDAVARATQALRAATQGESK